MIPLASRPLDSIRVSVFLTVLRVILAAPVVSACHAEQVNDENSTLNRHVESGGLSVQCTGDSVEIWRTGSEKTGGTDATLLLPWPCCADVLVDRLFVVEGPEIRREMVAKVDGSSDYILALDDCYGRGLAMLLRHHDDSLSMVDIFPNTSGINSDFGFFVFDVVEKRLMSTGRLDLSVAPEDVKPEVVLYSYRYDDTNFVVDRKVRVPDSLFEASWRHSSDVPDSAFLEYYRMGRVSGHSAGDP